MQYTISGDIMPSLNLTLRNGEAVCSQSGGMAWMDSSIHMETNMKGGLMKGLGRMFSGASLFLVTYTAGRDGAQITFVPPMPGMVVPFDVSQSPVICQKSSFLCAEESVELNVVFTKKFSTGMFGGEGFILQELSGMGTAFLASMGSIVRKTLAPGEVLLVDTGSLVAFEPSVSYEVQTVKGFKNVLFGGEGLFLTRMTGPGNILLQTMTAESIARQIVPYIPSSGS